MEASADDHELFTVIRGKLTPAMIGDVLDEMGILHAFLPPEITPLAPRMTVVGRAMPVLETDGFDARQPFGLMMRALDDLRPGEVYLASGGSPRYALFGELMATAARRRGAAGAVLDGMVRDTEKVIQTGLPVFARGSYAQDQKHRGRVIDLRIDMEIAGVRIQPGDLVVGDLDGVIVIPRRVEEEALMRARQKASAENNVRAALEAGMSAEEAFRKFGVM